MLLDFITQLDKLATFAGLNFVASQKMKIRISDLSSTGLEINSTISLKNINDRMNIADDNDIVFLEAPIISLVLKKTSGGAESIGHATARFRQPCARCIKDAEQTIRVDLNFILKPRPVDRKEKVVDYESSIDDIGIAFYDGDTIDLEDLIQETIILSLSRYWMPDLDEQGRCSLCGEKAGFEFTRTKKTTNNLGDLIKKAQNRN